MVSACSAQFTDVKFEAALSKSFRHFLHLFSLKHKQLLILAIGSWAISVKIYPLQFLHRLRQLCLHPNCVSLTSRRSNNCRRLKYSILNLCLVTWTGTQARLKMTCCDKDLSAFFLCKCRLVGIRTTGSTQQEQ